MEHTLQKRGFCNTLEEEVTEVPNLEELIIGGDLNGHMEASRERLTDVMGPL